MRDEPSGSFDIVERNYGNRWATQNARAGRDLPFPCEGSVEKPRLAGAVDN